MEETDNDVQAFWSDVLGRAHHRRRRARRQRPAAGRAGRRVRRPRGPVDPRGAGRSPAPGGPGAGRHPPHHRPGGCWSRSVSCWNINRRSCGWCCPPAPTRRCACTGCGSTVRSPTSARRTWRSPHPRPRSCSAATVSTCRSDNSGGCSTGPRDGPRGCGWPCCPWIRRTSTARSPGSPARERLVAEYLIEEVTDRLPAPDRQFLLTTSVADRLSAGLADVLTGRSDSQQTLERLVDAQRAARRSGRSHRLVQFPPAAAGPAAVPADPGTARHGRPNCTCGPPSGSPTRANRSRRSGTRPRPNSGTRSDGC